MKEDNLVNMNPVIELLKVHDQRIRKFIENGTKTDFDQNPATVLESLTWRIQNNTKTLPQKKTQSKPLIKCPKCSKFDKNRCPNNLKLHIFHHYLHFWKEKIPDIEGKETVCEQVNHTKIDSYTLMCLTARLEPVLHIGMLFTVKIAQCFFMLFYLA